MSEELSYQLYKWLSALDVVPPTLRYKPNGNYQLDSKTSDGLLNGYLIAKLLLFLARNFDAVVNQPLLASIKQSSTPAARMYNWNILSESFSKLNVSVPKSTLKQITSGNYMSLSRFLLQLHKRFNSKKAQKREQNLEQSDFNLRKLQVLQSLDEAETFLELVILILSSKLNLTPKQVISTLNDNAKYYAHMVVKGIKNSFSQILSMVDTFIQQLSQLMFLSEKDPEKNIQFFLDLVKPMLISRQSEVAKKGAQLFARLVDQSLKYNSKNLVYQILCKEHIGFDFLYMALKRHPDLSSDFTAFLFPLVRQALPDFFEVHLRRTINNHQEYLKILLRLVEGFSTVKESQIALKQSGMLAIWLKSCESSFDGSSSREDDLVNEETRILCLELLCNIWKEYSQDIDQEEAESLLVRGINELKRNTRKDIYTIKIPALLRIFDFLHFLANTKNAIAPIVYKKLIFLMIENHDVTEVRQIILDNFTIVLRKYPSIPIDFLLEPLLKQLISSEGKSYLLNIFDFQFLLEVCKHPRMDSSFALSYLEYFSKLYIKSFIYAKLTIRVIHVLTSRFCEEEAIIEFIKKTVEITLSQYGILTFNKHKSSREDRIINKQRQSLSIELLKHFVQLEHRQLQDYILDRVTGLYLLWLEQKKHHNKGLRYLIQLYGDVEEITLQYNIKLHSFSQEQPSLQSDDTERSSKPTPKSEAYHEQEYLRQKGIGYKDRNKPHKTHADSLINAYSLKPEPHALEQLAKIKQKLKQGANRRREQEDHELRKVKEKKNINSMQLMQRNLSLGYAKMTPTLSNQMLFNFGSVKQGQLKLAIHFYSLDELQGVDGESARVVFRNYSKDIKSLFLKHALISSTNGSLQREETVSVMSFTEVIKMLNEKGIGFINKLVVGDLIASINHSKRKEKNILYGIQETDFNQFLTRLTDYLIQHEQSAPEVPFGLRLQKLLKSLLASEPFYENKFRIKEDPKITELKQMVRKGEENQFDLPEGYKKVRQSQVQMKYEIGESHCGIGQSFRTAYEVTDWLINRCMGFHIASPKVSVKQVYTLIQIPKTFTAAPKHASQERIHDQKQLQTALPHTQQRRSKSQRVIHKSKQSAAQAEDQKQKAAKRQKYLEQMKQNLQRLKKEKKKKEEQQLKSKQQNQEQQQLKQKRRKQYLNSNRQKLKHFKQKQQQEEQQKKAQERRVKEQVRQELKGKQKLMLNKHEQQIKQMAQKRSDKNQALEKSAKPLVSSTHPAKPNPSLQKEKLFMTQITNSLESGALHETTNEFDKQLKELMQAYWVWEQKRIDLKAVALILKDFKISPEYILPKTLSETYKMVGKGLALDSAGFVQCLAKCAYRSAKILQQSGQSEQQVGGKAWRWLLVRLKMQEFNYKQVIHTVKNHLE